MANKKNSFIQTIPKFILTLISIIATVSMPFKYVKANDTYEQLQKTLISQNNSQGARILANGLPTSSVNPLRIEEIKQVAKQQNATLVQYSIINDEFNIAGKKQIQESELYIWVIKPTGEIGFRSVDLKPLWQKEQTSLADLVEGSRRWMSASNRSVKRKIQVEMIEQENKGKQETQKLYQILIQPIADLLPTQPDEHVIFIPQSVLFFVPFAALPDPNGKYLIEKHTLAIAPSIQVLDLLYQRQRQIQGVAKDVLIVNNPARSRNAEEANTIAHIFNTKSLTGDAATETAVVQRMPQAKIIHLATAVLPNSEPGFGSALALAPSAEDDGLLTSEEILKLNLKAELVVLCANNTALGKITSDGVIGFSRSFFSAGVSSVVGSLWDISDHETAFLMTEFYKKLSENPDKSAALRHAILVTMKKYPNPQYWAVFTLIGKSE